jgi:hypothetical protein
MAATKAVARASGDSVVSFQGMLASAGPSNAMGPGHGAGPGASLPTTSLANNNTRT